MSELSLEALQADLDVAAKYGGPMREQMTLDIPPASHRHDPKTSKAAERKANIGGQALQVYTALRAHGPTTMHQLADLSGIDYYVCQRRVSVLHHNGLAERVGTAENPDTGNQCAVDARRERSVMRKGGAVSPLTVALLAAAGVVLLAIDPVAWAGLLALAVVFALALELSS